MIPKYKMLFFFNKNFIMESVKINFYYILKVKTKIKIFLWYYWIEKRKNEIFF